MIDNESLQNLEKLHQLKTDGVITEADFEAAKDRLLSGSVKAAKAAPAAPTDTGPRLNLQSILSGRTRAVRSDPFKE